MNLQQGLPNSHFQNRSFEQAFAEPQSQPPMKWEIQLVVEILSKLFDLIELFEL